MILTADGHEGHPILLQAKYDDLSRGLRGVRLTIEESKAAYTCRRCGEYQGCAVCIDDVASLVCRNCRDWANDLSERVHGKMVNQELAQHGMQLIMMLAKRKLTKEDFIKLWDEARAQGEPAAAK